MTGTSKKRKFNFRALPLYIIFTAAILFFIVKLVNIQITGTDRYVKTMALTREREVAVQSLRGEIFDRNGTPLVKNEYTEDVMLDYQSMPTDQAEINETLRKKPETFPSSDGWGGPYLYKDAPKDPWGHEYEYTNPAPDGSPYGIRSFGADGIDGGEGKNADIKNWE